MPQCLKDCIEGAFYWNRALLEINKKKAKHSRGFRIRTSFNQPVEYFKKAIELWLPYAKSMPVARLLLEGLAKRLKLWSNRAGEKALIGFSLLKKIPKTYHPTEELPKNIISELGKTCSFSLKQINNGYQFLVRFSDQPGKNSRTLSLAIREKDLADAYQLNWSQCKNYTRLSSLKKDILSQAVMIFSKENTQLFVTNLPNEGYQYAFKTPGLLNLHKLNAEELLTARANKVKFSGTCNFAGGLLVRASELDTRGARVMVNGPCLFKGTEQASTLRWCNDKGTFKAENDFELAAFSLSNINGLVHLGGDPGALIKIKILTCFNNTQGELQTAALSQLYFDFGRATNVSGKMTIDGKINKLLCRGRWLQKKKGEFLAKSAFKADINELVLEDHSIFHNEASMFVAIQESVSCGDFSRITSSKHLTLNSVKTQIDDSSLVRSNYAGFIPKCLVQAKPEAPILIINQYETTKSITDSIRGFSEKLIQEAVCFKLSSAKTAKGFIVDLFVFHPKHPTQVFSLAIPQEAFKPKQSLALHSFLLTLSASETLKQSLVNCALLLGGNGELYFSHFTKKQKRWFVDSNFPVTFVDGVKPENVHVYTKGEEIEISTDLEIHYKTNIKSNHLDIASPVVGDKVCIQARNKCTLSRGSYAYQSLVLNPHGAFSYGIINAGEYFSLNTGNEWCRLQKPLTTQAKVQLRGRHVILRYRLFSKKNIEIQTNDYGSIVFLEKVRSLRKILMHGRYSIYLSHGSNLTARELFFNTKRLSVNGHVNALDNIETSFLDEFSCPSFSAFNVKGTLKLRLNKTELAKRAFELSGRLVLEFPEALDSDVVLTENMAVSSLEVIAPKKTMIHLDAGKQIFTLPQYELHGFELTKSNTELFENLKNTFFSSRWHHQNRFLIVRQGSESSVFYKKDKEVREASLSGQIDLSCLKLTQETIIGITKEMAAGEKYFDLMKQVSLVLGKEKDHGIKINTEALDVQKAYMYGFSGIEAQTTKSIQIGRIPEGKKSTEYFVTMISDGEVILTSQLGGVNVHGAKLVTRNDNAHLRLNGKEASEFIASFTNIGGNVYSPNKINVLLKIDKKEFPKGTREPTIPGTYVGVAALHESYFLPKLKTKALSRRTEFIVARNVYTNEQIKNLGSLLAFNEVYRIDGSVGPTIDSESFPEVIQGIDWALYGHRKPGKAQWYSRPINKQVDYFEAVVSTASDHKAKSEIVSFSGSHYGRSVSLYFNHAELTKVLGAVKSMQKKPLWELTYTTPSPEWLVDTTGKTLFVSSIPIPADSLPWMPIIIKNEDLTLSLPTSENENRTYPPRLALEIINRELRENFGHHVLEGCFTEKDNYLYILNKTLQVVEILKNRQREGIKTPFPISSLDKIISEIIVVHQRTYLEDGKLFLQPRIIDPKPIKAFKQVQGFILKHGLYLEGFDVGSKKSTLKLGLDVRGTSFKAITSGEQTISGDIAVEEDVLICSIFGTLNIKSLKERVGGDQHFYDKLHLARICARSIQLMAGQDIVLEGARTDSQVKTLMTAMGNIFDIPVVLESQQVHQICEKRKKGTRTDVSIEQAVSSHISQREIVKSAGKNLLEIATQSKAPQIKHTAKGQSIYDVASESKKHIEDVTIKKGGILRKKKHQSSSSVSETSKGCVFAGEFESTSGGDMSMTGVVSLAKTTLKSETGDIYLNASKDTDSFKALENSENLLWVRQAKRTKESTTYHPCQFTGEVIILKANKVVIDKIYGQTLEFAKRLKLPEGTQVTYRELRNHYFYEHKSKGMPSQGVMVLAAIAITIATDGAGAGLVGSMGLAEGSFLLEMANLITPALNAAITGTANLAARSLMQNEGDPKKALKAMGQKEVLKSLATQVLSANVLYGLSSVAGIDSDASSMMESCKYNLSRCLIDTTLQTVIHKEKFGKAFNRSIVDALVDTVANTVTDNVGAKKDKGKIGGVQQKIVQTGLGATAGAITRGKKGAAAGAIGSLFATMVADVYKPDLSAVPKDLKGREEFVKTKSGHVKLVATAMSLLTGEDVSVASRMAGMYLDNAYKNSLTNEMKNQDEAKVLLEKEQARLREERVARVREEGAQRSRSESLFEGPMAGDLASVPQELRAEEVLSSPLNPEEAVLMSPLPSQSLPKQATQKQKTTKTPSQPKASKNLRVSRKEPKSPEEIAEEYFLSRQQAPLEERMRELLTYPEPRLSDKPVTLYNVSEKGSFGKKEASWYGKAFGTVLDFFVPAAHAETLSQYQERQRRESTSPNPKPKTPYQEMAEAQLEHYRGEAAGAAQNSRALLWGAYDASRKINHGQKYALKRTAQGAAQLGLQIGEKINLVSPEYLSDFTAQVLRDALAYERNPLSNSWLSTMGRVGTETILFYGAGTIGTIGLTKVGYTPGLVTGSAIGGGFTFGLEPTMDGRFSTRIGNTFLGAGFGAVGGYGLDKTFKAIRYTSPILVRKVRVFTEQLRRDRLTQVRYLGKSEKPILHQYSSQDIIQYEALKTELRQQMERPVVQDKGHARNNFNISQQPSSSKSIHPDLARNANAQINLNKKMSALEGAQRDAVKVEHLPDGRIRYYDVERPARTDGPTRGSSFVTEHNPKNGQVRQWNESYDQFGNVNRVHPKTLDGQDVRARHYPPTKSEVIKSSKKYGGPK